MGEGILVMQRPKRNPKDTKKRNRAESLDFNQVVNDAERIFRQGLAAEQRKQFQTACEQYQSVMQLLQQFPLTEWRRSEFRQAMQAVERLASLIEEGNVSGDLQALAENACKIYHESPGIQCVDFRLTALRMLLARYGVRWDDEVLTNAVSPILTTERLSVIEEGMLKLNASIDAVDVQTQAQTNARHALSARSFIMLGSCYLELAQYNKAISAYLTAMQSLAAMTIKDQFYIASLHRIFRLLDMHINLDKEYAVLHFARRLLSGNIQENPDFAEFAALFLQVENQHHDLNQVKLSMWEAFIAVLRQRVGNGNFALGQDERYPSDFPDCDFWEALEHSEYQHQLAGMSDILVQHARFSPATPKPPPLDVSHLGELFMQPVLPQELEYCNNGQILPDFPEVTTSFYGNSDFMFFGSLELSPKRDRQSPDLDANLTPSKDSP